MHNIHASVNATAFPLHMRWETSTNKHLIAPSPLRNYHASDTRTRKKIIFASINKERKENIREMEIKKIINHMKPKRETERWVRERGRSSKRSQRKNADVARSANTQQRFINTRRGKSLARERKSSLCRVSFWISRQRQKWVIRLFPCFTCEKKSKPNRGECHSRDLWH